MTELNKNMIYSQKVAEEVAKLLLSIDAMSFRFDPPYTYTTGLKSPIYLDNRLVMSYPKVRNKIITYYLEIVRNEISEADFISATATAAIPQGAWIADRLNLPMVFVRPSTKMHGKGSKVEGHFSKGDTAVIIEDHISTAASVIGNAESIRELGGKISYCVATTTYETEISEKVLKDNKIKLITLTTGKIIVEIARKMGKISEKERESVEKWFKNPSEWAKNEGFE